MIGVFVGQRSEFYGALKNVIPINFGNPNFIVGNEQIMFSRMKFGLSMFSEN